jgi:excisionase family DNA binding protein
MGIVLSRAVAPTAEEAELARRSSQRLSPYASRRLRLRIPANGRAGQVLDLPAAAVNLLLRILTEMAEGNAVTLVPIHAELTTQQAADFLNVSRPFLINHLLKAKKLKYHQVGAHRRIKYRDLLEYRRRSDAARERAVRQLTAEAEDLDLGY